MPDPAEPSATPQGLDAAKASLRPLVLARNASGLEALAERCGVSKSELAAYVRGVVDEEVETGNPERLGPRFDIHTGEYVGLEEWAESCLKSL